VSRQLSIPHLGTELTLAADWTFRLFTEHRNDGLVQAAGLTHPYKLLPEFWQAKPAERQAAIEKSKWRDADGSMPRIEDRYYSGYIQHPLTLPAGTVLTIDRIFIRKGSSDFDSVSFWLKAKQAPIVVNGRTLKKSVRFWAKLDDANQIQFKEP
jgi:hypothetical protein